METYHVKYSEKPVSQEMAINVTGSNGLIRPVPGHEAHVSFRRAEKLFPLVIVWVWQQGAWK